LNKHLKYGGMLLILIIVQRTFIWLIAVTSFDVTPDLVLIGLVYIGIKEGKTYGSIAGFFSGLTVDFVSFSFLGLMALSKAAAGFTSGFFNDENKTDRFISGYTFVIIVLFCSLVNNIIYYTVYFQGGNLQFTDILVRYALPTAVYTAIFAVIPVIYERRKRIR
jgi:rod shape-determining protein MreD